MRFLATRGLTLAALSTVAAFGVTLPDSPARAETTTSHDESLADVRAQIEALETAVADDKAEFQQTRAAVLELEKSLAEAYARQAEYAEQLKSKTAAVAELRDRRDRNRHLIRQQMSSISRGILARYLLWRQPKIKLLLNESDVNAISRNIRYHDYFIKAYTGRVETIRRELDQLEAVESALKLEADKLRLTRLESDKHLGSLLALQKKRGRAVSELQKRLERREEALAQLKLDEQRLQSLVEEIGDALGRAPPGGGLAPFSELKGALEWPTVGAVVKAPGDALREGGAQWSGVVIESEPGAAVTAVGSGMVVFVDWFRNLGLLIIIDHGGGYMSLYGHNQSVQVEAGDWVEPGQIISYVGDTGGRTHSGLYFEIRHDGEPQDPRQWCAAR